MQQHRERMYTLDEVMKELNVSEEVLLQMLPKIGVNTGLPNELSEDQVNRIVDLLNDSKSGNPTGAASRH